LLSHSLAKAGVARAVSASALANLEADLQALGFDICDLAANGQQASQLAMNNQPDVVLMDINLEGGREGKASK
jgi:CheY-like chemotaxis protein